MQQHPPPMVPRPGEYVVHLGQNTPENIETATAMLKRNGCRSFRVDANTDGSISVNGFLAEVH